MKNRFLIAFFAITLFFIGCEEKEVDFVSGSLYSVTTTEGEGFVVFEHVGENEWNGCFYLSKGQLMGEKRKVHLKIGEELALVDEDDKEMRIISYWPYQEPEFKDYPDTWTYRDSAYSVSVKEDVEYGHAQGYWVSFPDMDATYLEIYLSKRGELEQGEKDLKLTFDAYLPNDSGDISRPLLVLIHGGAFFNGDKKAMGYTEWARYFASRGYVVASVNYRLGFKLGISGTTSVKKAGLRAVQDVDAAIRYIIHNKDTFAVDSNRVFVAGTSAGGITALNVAFLRDENIPSEAKELGCIKSINPEMIETYNIRAVGNMWGAVNDMTILDNAQSSVISFHSTEDPIVPFEEGYPFNNLFFVNSMLFPKMYGSEKITECLGDERATFIPFIRPDKHDIHIAENIDGEKSLSSDFYEIETAMRDFFSSYMLPSPIELKHSDNSQTFQLISSDVETAYWHVEGGAILKQSDKSIDVLLFPDTSEHSVTVCGKYKSGLTFRCQWKL